MCVCMPQHPTKPGDHFSEGSVLQLCRAVSHVYLRHSTRQSQKTDFSEINNLRKYACWLLHMGNINYSTGWCVYVYVYGYGGVWVPPDSVKQSRVYISNGMVMDAIALDKTGRLEFWNKYLNGEPVR